ncbi:MAG: hypothetical protein M3077_11450 [Candidatus Dormibacteraeota bacterium]|nr:hypothetical protein [Candidatus Dormibacteraeota bacterium]
MVYVIGMALVACCVLFIGIAAFQLPAIARRERDDSRTSLRASRLAFSNMSTRGSAVGVRGQKGFR